MLKKQAVALIALLSFCGSPSAQAQLPPGEKAGATISMDVTEAYLEDVLKLLSKQSGMNFVAADDVRGKQVTLYFEQVPIFDALESLLQANHLLLIPREGKNLYVVAESGAPRIQTLTKIFQFRYARVVPTAGELTKKFGLTGSLIRETLSTSSSSTSSSSGTSGTTSTGSGGTGSTSSAVADEPVGGPVKAVEALLTEHGSVTPDARTNSLIVTDVPSQMKVIEELIRKLDEKPKQIFLEAEVIEVSLETLRRLGIEWGTSAGQVATWDGPARTSFFPFSRGLLDGATRTNTLGTLSLASTDAVLKLLATESDVKFLARPRLLTLSNEVTEIRIITEAITGTTTGSQATTETVTTEPERATVGTILRVTPMVNDNKFITMIIEPEVSRVKVSTFNSSFQDPSRRLARTTVMVPDGGTAMIAGLISSESSDGNRKVPGLGDLPIIGLPFKRKEMEKKNTEILLFITPHLLPDDETKAKPVFPREREQVPLTLREEQALQGHRRRILKERGIVETIDSVAW